MKAKILSIASIIFLSLPGAGFSEIFNVDEVYGSWELSEIKMPEGKGPAYLIKNHTQDNGGAEVSLMIMGKQKKILFFFEKDNNLTEKFKTMDKVPLVVVTCQEDMKNPEVQFWDYDPKSKLVTCNDADGVIKKLAKGDRLFIVFSYPKEKRLIYGFDFTDTDHIFNVYPDFIK
jgi:hypothetical protein